MHEIADLPIPGCAHTHERGYDPCEPHAVTHAYFGGDALVVDAAIDFGAFPCPCTEDTIWALPDDDCWICLGTGVIIERDRDADVVHCSHCAGETYDNGTFDDERADCSACLGTGYRFARPKLTSEEWDEYERQQQILTRQRAETEAAAAYYYALAEQQGLLPPSEPPPAEARWQTRIITLDSEERRPCGHCNDGWASVNGTKRRCTSCDGSATVPVTRGPWLCSVDVNTAYYEHKSGRLASDRSGVHEQGELLPGWTLRFGSHNPRFLPTQRTVPFHRNDPVRTEPRKAYTIGGQPSLVPARSYRTSDGVRHPVECHWREGEYEYFTSSDSLIRAKG